MGNVNIAIVTPCTITFLGLKSLLCDLPSVSAGHIADASSLADGFDLYVVDAALCLSHVGFFLPLRRKPLVVLAEPLSESSFAFVCTKWDVERIGECLIDFVDAQRSAAAPQSELSQREIEVLTLVASGKINKEIADALQISINTVLTHRKNISAKLGIKSVSGLSVYAMMNGYLLRR